MPDAEAATTFAPLRVDQQAGHLSPQVLLSRMRQSKQGTPSGADPMNVLPGRKSNTVTRLTRDTRGQLVLSFGKTRSAVCMARVRDEATTSCMLCCTGTGTAWCRVFACARTFLSAQLSLRSNFSTGACSRLDVSLAACPGSTADKWKLHGAQACDEHSPWIIISAGRATETCSTPAGVSPASKASSSLMSSRNSS